MEREFEREKLEIERICYGGCKVIGEVPRFALPSDLGSIGSLYAMKENKSLEKRLDARLSDSHERRVERDGQRHFEDQDLRQSLNFPDPWPKVYLLKLSPDDVDEFVKYISWGTGQDLQIPMSSCNFLTAVYLPLESKTKKVSLVCYHGGTLQAWHKSATDGWVEGLLEEHSIEGLLKELRSIKSLSLGPTDGLTTEQLRRELQKERTLETTRYDRGGVLVRNGIRYQRCLPANPAIPLTAMESQFYVDMDVASDVYLELVHAPEEELVARHRAIGAVAGQFFLTSESLSESVQPVTFFKSNYDSTNPEGKLRRLPLDFYAHLFDRSNECPRGYHIKRLLRREAIIDWRFFGRSLPNPLVRSNSFALPLFE